MKLKVRVLSVDREVLNTEAEAIVAHAPDGEFTLLPNHIPVIVPLKIEKVELLGAASAGDKNQPLAVHGGVLRTDGKEVLILTEAAELPEEIDKERALAAKERAERRIAQAKISEEIDLTRAEAALMRALLRLKMTHH
ncbi:MAG: ATP synthase F1 subunit epsilon [Planctomycetota bacterium]|nr:ATP synthase F1 subunit epsilon [Planctomycetota bacterium]